MAQTLYWYDLETSGTEPRWDRIVQFGGFRTDMDLNPIGEPQTFYCKPAQDLLPNPEACLVTGITPQYALEHGLTEVDFMVRVHDLFSRPGHDFRVIDGLITNFHLPRSTLIMLVAALVGRRRIGQRIPIPEFEVAPVSLLAEIDSGGEQAWHGFR